MNAEKLVFVYNAEAGFVNGMMDSLHKTLSPNTYECALCAITHGFFTMDKAWRAYLKSLPYEATFYHRADFAETYPNAKLELPSIAIDRKGALIELVNASQMHALKNVDALIAALDAALADAVGNTANT